MMTILYIHGKQGSICQKAVGVVLKPWGPQGQERGEFLGEVGSEVLTTS